MSRGQTDRTKPKASDLTEQLDLCREALAKLADSTLRLEEERGRIAELLSLSSGANLLEEVRQLRDERARLRAERTRVAVLLEVSLEGDLDKTIRAVLETSSKAGLAELAQFASVRTQG